MRELPEIGITDRGRTDVGSSEVLAINKIKRVRKHGKLRDKRSIKREKKRITGGGGGGFG